MDKDNQPRNGTLTPAQKPDALLTLADAMAQLQIKSRSTFWKLRAEYGLPVVRAGGLVRIRQSALDAWIDRHTVNGNGGDSK
jgi:excisionase family DNA binding protein